MLLKSTDGAINKKLAPIEPRVELSVIAPSAVTAFCTTKGVKLLKVMTLPLPVLVSLASVSVPVLLNEVNPPPGILDGVIVAVELLLKAPGRTLTDVYEPVVVIEAKPRDADDGLTSPPVIDNAPPTKVVILLGKSTLVEALLLAVIAYKAPVPPVIDLVVIA